jgi:simple sugar transport system permease protein
MSQLIEIVFSATFAVTVIRASTPLLFATLGGLLSDLGGALNVALEGMMLIAALTAVIVSVHAPWYIAVISGMGAGAMLGGLMALFHLRYKADVILVGFAINILAAGGTVFALSLATGGDKGTSINLPSKAIPSIDIPAFQNLPILNLLSGHSALSWLAAVSVAAVWYFLYRTPWGLWLRAVGEFPAAPQAAGISVMAVRTWSLVASGALAGLGGVQLAMFNYVGFTRDMTAGRGFIALGAVLLGARHPVGAMFAALLFGLFEALAIVMPGLFTWVPSEIIQSIPFTVTLLALILFSYRSQQRTRAQK